MQTKSFTSRAASVLVVMIGLGVGTAASAADRDAIQTDTTMQPQATDNDSLQQDEPSETATKDNALSGNNMSPDNRRGDTPMDDGMSGHHASARTPLEDDGKPANNLPQGGSTDDGQ